MPSALPARPLAVIKPPARFGDTSLAASWPLILIATSRPPGQRLQGAQPAPKFGAASRQRSIRNDLKRAIGEPNPILAGKCQTNAHGDGPGPPCPGSGEALNSSEMPRVAWVGHLQDPLRAEVRTTDARALQLTALCADIVCRYPNGAADIDDQVDNGVMKRTRSLLTGCARLRCHSIQARTMRIACITRRCNQIATRTIGGRV
jgi:hypothetical protein